MDRLDDAVRAGIITADQRQAIRDLDVPTEEGFRLSLVHLLWLGGLGLIVFALVLVAAEISHGQPEPLMWTCLVYTGGLALLDWALQGRRDMRLLSSLVFLGMTISAGFGIDAALAPEDAYWHSLRYPDYALGLVAVLSGLLIWWRGFLPAWLVFGGAVCWLYFIEVDPSHREEKYHALGLAVLFFAGGWIADLKCKANHGFWLNKIGLSLLFVFILGCLFSSKDMPLLLAVSLAGLGFALFVRRPGGVSMAALGVAIFLEDWVGASLYVEAAVLALLGLGAIFLGVKAHLLEDQLDRLLPDAVKRVRPEAREDPVTFGF